MKRIVRAGWAVLGLTLGLAGCATAPRLGGVSVSLVSIRPVEAALLETTAELTLRLTNESPRPLALGGSAHRLYVNGTYVGRAMTSQAITIPPLGTTTQVVTAHLENLALMRKVQELGNATSVDYRIDSQLHLAAETGGGVVGATASGQLDLGGLMGTRTPAVGGQ
jgi:LEA14-like dessication related protein